MNNMSFILQNTYKIVLNCVKIKDTKSETFSKYLLWFSRMSFIFMKTTRDIDFTALE